MPRAFPLQNGRYSDPDRGIAMGEPTGLFGCQQGVFRRPGFADSLRGRLNRWAT